MARMTPEVLHGIRNRLLARQQSADLDRVIRSQGGGGTNMFGDSYANVPGVPQGPTNDFQGGVGHPGPSDPVGVTWPPEYYGRWSPTNDVNQPGTAPSDDTTFLNTMPPNLGPDSFAGTVAGSRPGYGGEPTVQVPTTLGQYPQPQMPGAPISSDLMPSLNLAQVNQAIRNTQGIPNLSARPSPLLSDRPGGANPDLGGFGQPMGFFPSAGQNPPGSYGVGGQGGSFFGGRGNINLPGGGALAPDSPGGSLGGTIGGIIGMHTQGFRDAMAQGLIPQGWTPLGTGVGGYTGRNIKNIS